MDVVVKNWSLPKGCIVCPFFTGQGCKVSMQLFDDNVKLSVRQDICPLEEQKSEDDYVNPGNTSLLHSLWEKVESAMLTPAS